MCRKKTSGCGSTRKSRERLARRLWMKCAQRWKTAMARLPTQPCTCLKPRACASNVSGWASRKSTASAASCKSASWRTRRSTHSTSCGWSRETPSVPTKFCLRFTSYLKTWPRHRLAHSYPTWALKGIMRRVIATIAIGACMFAGITAHAATENWKQQFATVSDQFFDQVYFHYSPTNGTLVGYHQYDSQLEDFSRKSIDAEIAALK